MAVLAANIEIQRKDGELISSPVVAADIIYKGALVKKNAAGHLAPCAAEAGAVFDGIAYEKVDNSAGAAAALNCRVLKSGEFLLTGSGFALTDVGQAVYATDDQLITKTYADNIQRVGVISEYVSSTKVWVKIQPGVLGNEAAIADATDAGSAITQLNLALAVMRKHNMIAV